MIKVKGKIFTFLLFLSLVLIFNNNTTIGCKDIVAVGDSTKGDYNLLMKVRDPSRPGIQVLCMVPEGYDYSYNNPKTGKIMDFESINSYIGVTTTGDTIPNIVKPGMVLTSSGLAFGDADTGSNWVNYRRYAWDDFDWIRYACEKAKNEDEAVELLTEDVVDTLHAPGVSEK